MILDFRFNSFATVNLKRFHCLYLKISNFGRNLVWQMAKSLIRIEAKSQLNRQIRQI